MQQLVLSLRHVTFISGAALTPNVVRRCWNNASKLSLYARHYVTMPEEEEGIAQAAAEVIQESARLKMELARAIICQLLTPWWRIRYTQRALEQYQRLRDAAAKLGKQIDPEWGIILPCQL